MIKTTHLICSAAFIGTYPFSVHTDMYAPTIKGQGTDEQIAEFLPKAETYQHIGTYAQTELGHGELWLQHILI